MQFARLAMGRGSNPGVAPVPTATGRRGRQPTSVLRATRRGMIPTLRYQAEVRAQDLLWEPSRPRVGRSRSSDRSDPTRSSSTTSPSGPPLASVRPELRTPTSSWAIHGSPLSGETYGVPGAWPSALRRARRSWRTFDRSGGVSPTGSRARTTTRSEPSPRTRQRSRTRSPLTDRWSCSLPAGAPRPATDGGPRAHAFLERRPAGSGCRQRSMRGSNAMRIVRWCSCHLGRSSRPETTCSPPSPTACDSSMFAWRWPPGPPTRAAGPMPSEWPDQFLRAPGEHPPTGQRPGYSRRQQQRHGGPRPRRSDAHAALLVRSVRRCRGDRGRPPRLGGGSEPRDPARVGGGSSMRDRDLSPALDRLAVELALRSGPGIARAAVGKWLGRVAAVGTPRDGDGPDRRHGHRPRRWQCQRSGRSTADRSRSRLDLVRRGLGPTAVTTSVVWFRRDLRLHDHPALTAAQSDGARIAPLFVLDERLQAGRFRSANRLWFMRGAISPGRRALEIRGAPLSVVRGDPSEVVPAFAAAVRAARVVASRDYTPYGRARRPGRCGPRSARHRVGLVPGSAGPRTGGCRHGRRPAVPRVRPISPNLA